MRKGVPARTGEFIFGLTPAVGNWIAVLWMCSWHLAGTTYWVVERETVSSQRSGLAGMLLFPTRSGPTGRTRKISKNLNVLMKWFTLALSRHDGGGGGDCLACMQEQRRKLTIFIKELTSDTKWWSLLFAGHCSMALSLEAWQHGVGLRTLLTRWIGSSRKKLWRPKQAT